MHYGLSALGFEVFFYTKNAHDTLITQRSREYVFKKRYPRTI